MEKNKIPKCIQWAIGNTLWDFIKFIISIAYSALIASYSNSQPSFSEWAAVLNISTELILVALFLVVLVCSYLSLSLVCNLINRIIIAIKTKNKTLKRVFAHIEHDANKIYVLIENQETKIDINCTNIIVYKINSLDRNQTISNLDIEDAFNSFFALGDKILSPYAKLKDIQKTVNHKNKLEVDLLEINSSENRLEFRTLSPRNPLSPGLYGLVFGFTVYPQREDYKDFDIYITAKINYRGGSDLELWELRNARTRD